LNIGKVPRGRPGRRHVAPPPGDDDKIRADSATLHTGRLAEDQPPPTTGETTNLGYSLAGWGFGGLV
jgi:hypothetical protein